MSYVGHALYNTAKHVAGLLSPFSRTFPSFVENSADLCDILRDIQIDSDEVLVSFDVKSLYTSVPIDLALDAVRSLLETTTKPVETQLTTDELIDLLSLCLRESSFQFRNQFYEMTNGLAMGSPASPIVANIFMAELEQTAIKTMVSMPKLWLRFVDDVLAIMKRQDVDTTLQHINEQHPDICFTMEIESDGSLPFLDTRIIRDGSQLQTTVYRKPTDTGRYLSFESHHPVSAQRSVVHALLSRALTIVSDDEERDREVQRVTQTLLANGYPSAFISRQLEHVRTTNARKTSSSPNNKKTATAPTATITVPFVAGTTQAIQRVLRPLGIRVIGRPNQWKWSIQHALKDSTDPQDQTGSVYKIKCKDCPSVYIGETGRSARVRLAEHLAHAKNGRVNLSAVAEHAIMRDHRINWTEPEVIDRDDRTISRRVKEALWINKTKDTMNKDRGLELNALWFSLNS